MLNRLANLRRLGDLPIQRKLTLIIMLSCGAALVLGALALALRYVADEREQLGRHMEILTRMAASNLTVALAFADAGSARGALDALAADPAVCAADVFEAGGELFASYRGACGATLPAPKFDPAWRRDLPSAPPPLTADHFRVVQPVLLDHDRIGTLVLVAGLAGLRADLMIDVLVMLLIVLLSGGVALLLASSLQKLVSEPIRRLAAIMHHVTVVKDYSLQVTRHGDDEIGELITGFNEMIDQIRRRDERLQQSRDQLMAAHRIAQLGDWECQAADGTDGADGGLRLRLSAEACEVFGIGGEATALGAEDFLARVHDFDRDWVRPALSAALSGETPLDIEHRVVDDAGETRTVHLRAKLAPAAAGVVARLVGTVQNVTERAKAEEQRRIGATALEHTVDSVMVLDASRRVVWVNQAFTRLTGYGRDSLLGRPPEQLYSDRQPATFYDEIWREVDAAGQWQGEVWSRRWNGEVFPQRLSISQILDPAGRVSHYVSVGNDIALSKQYEAQLEHLAHHDALTQLFNRAQFETRLRQTLACSARQGGSGALMFVDLDHFKAVNDTCGHGVGDQLLRAVAERIRQCVRDSDVVARLGGDEFAILLDGLAASTATKIAGNLVASLVAPFNIGGRQLQISSSIGISCYPEHGDDAESLLYNADQAMYRIKAAGRNGFRLYGAEPEAAAEAAPAGAAPRAFSV